MKSPPRTDFRRSLVEFKVLTQGASPGAVELWVGSSYPNVLQKQPDGTSTVVYDLPDASQVILTFNPDPQDPAGMKTSPGLVSVRHVSQDQWGKDVVEQIPLKQAIL